MNLLGKIADKLAGHRETAVGSAEPAKDPSGATMRAILWRGKQKVSLETVPRPTITMPEDALIRVTAATICGSDLHLYWNEVPMRSGAIMGHECMGIVERVGAGVKDIKVGQRVVASFDIACGQCEYCKKEQYTACDATNPSNLQKEMYGHRLAGIHGYSPLLGDFPGTQAEYLRVPFADVNLLPIPDKVPNEKALYLSDILCTSLHATELCSVSKGDVVGIWGLGPIGLLAAWWAKFKGAKRVIGIDNVPERLQVARDKLGIEVLDFTRVEEDKDVGSVVNAIFKMAPEGLDCAIEAAGFRYAKSRLHHLQRALKLETDSPELLKECIMTLKKFGRLSIIADYFGSANGFPIGQMMEKSIRVQGGQCPCQKYWKYVLGLLESGELDPSFVVTHWLRLEDMPEAYHTFDEKQQGMIKTFVRVSE